MRFSYWSSSKFSIRLRKKFGLRTPRCLSLEGWEEYEEESKTKSPVIHWITTKGMNTLQDVCMYPADKYRAFVQMSLWSFCRNVWVFRKALWNYRSWDFTGLLMFMETSARDMSRLHSDHGHLVRSEQTAKELKVWADIIERIVEDDYTSDKMEFVKGKGIFGGSFVQIKNTLPNIDSKAFYKLIATNKQNDLDLVAKTFARKCFTWWD